MTFGEQLKAIKMALPSIFNWGSLAPPTVHPEHVDPVAAGVFPCLIMEEDELLIERSTTSATVVGYQASGIFSFFLHVSGSSTIEDYVDKVLNGLKNPRGLGLAVSLSDPDRLVILKDQNLSQARIDVGISFAYET